MQPFVVHFGGVPHTVAPRPSRPGLPDPEPHDHTCMDCPGVVPCQGCDDSAEPTLCDACLVREMSA